MKASFQKTFDIAQTMLAGVGLEIQESATSLRDIPKDMRKYYKYTHAIVQRSDKAKVATIRMTQSEGLGPFLFMLAGVVMRYGETEGFKSAMLTKTLIPSDTNAQD